MLIPKYDKDGNLSATARNYRLPDICEAFIAKKKDEVVNEVRKFPEVEAYLLKQIMSGAEAINYDKDEEEDEFGDMTDAEFEQQMEEEYSDSDSNGSEAEETEDWKEL